MDYYFQNIDTVFLIGETAWADQATETDIIANVLG